MELKNYQVQVEIKADSKEKGVFEAYAAVFDNVDNGYDIVERGAFTDGLKENGFPPIVWSHKWGIPPIGKTLEMEERDKGLWGRGQLFIDEHEYAMQCYVGMREGALKEFSFAYDVIEASYETRDNIDIRLLKKLGIYEWGPTLVGMNRMTELLTVKGEPLDPELLTKLKSLDELQLSKLLDAVRDVKSEEPETAKDEERTAERKERVTELLLEFPE